MNEQRRLLQRPRNPYRPATVAEMALQLAGDRYRREGRELDPTVRIESIDRIQQAEVGDLDEIVEGFSASREPSGEVTGERQEALDELLSSSGIGEPAEEFHGPIRVAGRPVSLAHGVFIGDRVRNRIAGLPSSPETKRGSTVSPWITVQDQLSRSLGRGHSVAGTSVPNVISKDPSLVVISSCKASACGEESSKRIPASSTAIRTSSTASKGNCSSAAALAATTRKIWSASGRAATFTVMGVERSSTGSTYTRSAFDGDLRARRGRGGSYRARDRGSHDGHVDGPRGCWRARPCNRTGTPRARSRDDPGWTIEGRPRPHRGRLRGLERTRRDRRLSQARSRAGRRAGARCAGCVPGGEAPRPDRARALDRARADRRRPPLRVAG